jgi:hypothetical protein
LLIYYSAVERARKKMKEIKAKQKLLQNPKKENLLA